MRHSITLIFLLILCFFGCSKPGPGEPVQQPAEILKDYNSFFPYMKAHYKPNQDLQAFDQNEQRISKACFFEQLKTRTYLPLLLSSNDGKLYYRLYKMTDQQTKDVGGYIGGYANVWADNYSKEGKRFPKLEFTDINGKKYNAAGKTLVVKCWFIGCQRCEEEMPELNQLLARYKNRKDIVFVSLAPDSKERLQAFLKRKRFDYPIIPGQEAFMTDSLGITAYPTHLIVNKKGMVVNVVNDPEEIVWALEHKI